ncbi:MAG TPA: TRZ/ATZ family hydrolase [Thiotrichaceae bacterium]|jgi:5-methylthioadenosine/S-adenosylhomocysteine deaminase|nr:TRZ/ATZ family hydrolase [Thiotrichaceae bacterium]HIM09160.1 TRZ/ATZ family hydrolase [Gammaproteobacteria bacterium]
MNIDTLIHAKWIIPVEPKNTVHENYSVAIKDGKIEAILPTDKARAKFTATEEHNLGNHALIPGLVNAHTHAAMNLFRGLADDLPLMDWLNNHIWPAETKWVNPDFVKDGTEIAIAEMIRSGTTCFNDMYFFPDQTAEVCTHVGMRVVVGLILIDFPTAWAKDADEYIFKGEQVHDTYRHDPLINTAFAPHAPYTVSDEPLKRISVIAEELDIPIHMHIHETAFEVEQSIELHGKRPLQRLSELGLLSPRMLAVHMTQLEKAEIKELAKLSVSVVHCAESNLKLASGFCPVGELVKAGVNVCLGTDSAASNNDLDMLGEMRTAALLAKGVSNNSTCLDAHTTLKMATLNGAKALGLNDTIGSLKKGKQADIVAIDLNQLETAPLYDPVSQIVYSANRQQVSDVWIAGKQLLKDRELTNMEYSKLMEKAKEWEVKIKNE